MRSWWSFNRSILFFSALMVLLLLWLSVSFLMQAFSTRQEAQFLARYLHIDAVIKTTVTTVAQERAASHWLTGLEGIFSAENSLSIPPIIERSRYRLNDFKRRVEPESVASPVVTAIRKLYHIW